MERRINSSEGHSGCLASDPRILAAERPAVVHAHTPKAGLLGMLSALITRTPFSVYHMRGLPYLTATRLPTKAAEVRRNMVSCRLAHRVFCVSQSVREVAIHDGICPRDKNLWFWLEEVAMGLTVVVASTPIDSPVKRSEKSKIH